MSVLVLGGAVSGKAAARLARRLGRDVEVYDRNSVPLAALREEGFPIHSGAWSRRLLGGVDLVVVSPGFPETAQPIADAAAEGVPVVSELEFASLQIDAPIAAVTGTNGKTTVTTAAADMLVASGIKAVAAGNIGTALSDVADEDWDALVVEASSFQLRFIETFHPAVAVILNVADDHLDWHGTFDSYLAAKARIYENQSPSDLLVFDADDVGARRAITGATSRLVPVSGTRRPDGGNGPDDGRLVVGGRDYALPALDRAWLVDLTAAATAAQALGASVSGVEEVLGSFRPGNHRRTVVGTWNGVTFVNDSKATNPHAAMAAVAAYPSVVLIAGGRNKGLDLAPLVTAPTVGRVVAIGESAPDLEAADPSRVEVASDLEDAVDRAIRIAASGDTVLLAPGCASFDMFDDYQHRGDEFTRIVRSRFGGTE